MKKVKFKAIQQMLFDYALTNGYITANSEDCIEIETLVCRFIDELTEYTTDIKMLSMNEMQLKVGLVTFSDNYDMNASLAEVEKYKH